ncbi:MAG: hypothetical protein RR620_05660 [Clostridium sp.]
MGERDVYLVLSRTGTLLSRTIGYFTQDEYTHLSISFDDSLETMYSFGRTNPTNPFSGGFVVENIYEGVYKMFPNSKCLVYKIKVNDTQYKCLRDGISSFLENKELYKYNVLGLIGIKLNYPIDRTYYYFCSQFVFGLLIESGIYNGDTIASLSKPTDIFDLKNLDFYYEGYIREYQPRKQSVFQTV